MPLWEHLPESFCILPCTSCACVAGDRDLSICWLSPAEAEQRDPPLAFCTSANLRTIGESTPNPRVGNESYSRQYSQQPFHLLLHQPPFHDGRLGLSRYLQLDSYPPGPIAFRKAISASPETTAANQRGYGLGMLLLQIPVMEFEAVEGIQDHLEFRPLTQQVPSRKRPGG